jgi:hypothetical protein
MPSSYNYCGFTDLYKSLSQPQGRRPRPGPAEATAQRTAQTPGSEKATTRPAASARAWVRPSG